MEQEHRSQLSVTEVFAYAVDDVAVLAAGEDPMGHIRNQIADAINKLNSARLFSLLDGLFASGTGPLGANSLDVAKAGTSAVEANFLTASTVARGRSLLGERGEELDTLVIHPSVAYYLYQVGMLTFSTSALSTGGAVTWGVAVWCHEEYRSVCWYECCH